MRDTSAISALPLLRQNRPEVIPPLSVETQHAHLLDGPEVRRAGVHADAVEEHRNSYVLEARGLAHQVLASQIVAAALEHLDHQRRLHVRVAVRTVAEVSAGN